MLAPVELVIERGHIRVIAPDKDRGRSLAGTSEVAQKMSAYDSK
jgi:hypothetical protein